jgi:hypothetical protein
MRCGEITDLRFTKKLQLLGVGLVVLVVPGSVAVAQNVSTASTLSESRQSLIEATQEYKASTQTLLSIEEQEAEKAAQQLEQLRELVAEGLVARSELEQAEQAFASAQEKLTASRRQLTVADRTIAEVSSAEELAKSQAARTLVKPTASYSSSATIIRHTGPLNAVSDLTHIRAFFSTQFGRPMPTSAIGQSPTHNRLGLDHRHAVDVPLHPDSAEGKALMSYLREHGITFLAFRGAIPGVSTGPHIHIGRPSHRI